LDISEGPPLYKLIFGGVDDFGISKYNKITRNKSSATTLNNSALK